MKNAYFQVGAAFAAFTYRRSMKSWSTGMEAEEDMKLENKIDTASTTLKEV